MSWQKSNNRNAPKKSKDGWSDQDDAFFGSTVPPHAAVSNDKRNKKFLSAHSEKEPSKVSNWLSKATSMIPPPPGLRRKLTQQPKNLPRTPCSSSPRTNTTEMEAPRSRSRSRSRSKYVSSSNDNSLNISRRLKHCLLTQVPLACKHCHSIPFSMYRSHPFFGPTQRICASHEQSTVLRCAACSRFLSKDHPVNDDGHALCPTCDRTAIRHEDQLRRLYNTQVMEFLSVTYNLTLYRDRMASIPVRLVDETEMERMSSTYDTHPHFGTMDNNDPHAGHSVGMKKHGLTIWTQSNLMFGSSNFKVQRQGKYSATSSSRGSRNVEVISILILKGLPASLTAAILVHEAIHAWFAINPTRSKGGLGIGLGIRGGVRKIPSQIEEGCCQLVSHLYLRHLISKDSNTSSEEGKDKELREYFRWSIETDTSEVYGDGFRKAAVAYDRVCNSGGGLLMLLEHVCSHLDLPPGGV